jgi:hypothetical protein
MENPALRQSYEVLEQQFEQYPDIVELVKEYVENYSVADIMLGKDTPFCITNSAQAGITLAYGSMLFRILTGSRKANFVINFVSWRGWEKVVPIQAKNHFRIKRGYYTKNGYDHSFKFKTSKEVCDFFIKYITSEKGYACVFK